MTTHAEIDDLRAAIEGLRAAARGRRRAIVSNRAITRATTPHRSSLVGAGVAMNPGELPPSRHSNTPPATSA